MLRATLHEHEIRRAIGAPGEGDFVVEGVAPLDANEDQCLYFINREVIVAVRESLRARNGCIVIVRRGSALVGELSACRVLEVAAGDGHLTRALSANAPDLRVIASDSGKWERPQARMSPRERRELRGTAIAGIRPGSEVVRLDVRAAIDRFQPDLVLACWLPPGPLLGRILRASDGDVLEIGAGSGITGDIACWRYEHEFCDELDALGRCRLDERPSSKLHTRVTLYEPRRR